MPFDAYDKTIREYAINEYLKGSRTQKSICAEIGIGQATISRWVKEHYKRTAPPKENKEGFVQELSEVLQAYAKRKFKYIEYTSSKGFETIKICFEDEPDKEYNVTGHNCIEIMGVIAHALT